MIRSSNHLKPGILVYRSETPSLGGWVIVSVATFLGLDGGCWMEEWRSGSLGKRRGGFDIGEFRWEVLGRWVGGWVTMKNVLFLSHSEFQF